MIMCREILCAKDSVIGSESSPETIIAPQSEIVRRCEVPSFDRRLCACLFFSALCQCTCAMSGCLPDSSACPARSFLHSLPTSFVFSFASTVSGVSHCFTAHSASVLTSFDDFVETNDMSTMQLTHQVAFTVQIAADVIVLNAVLVNDLNGHLQT